MKLPTLVLVASLFGNAVLATVVLVNRADTRPGPDSSTAPHPADAARSSGVAQPGTPAAGGVNEEASGTRQLVALLRSGDAAGLARALREAGVSEELIRALVREQVSAPFRARIRAIEDAARGDRPWWQTGGRLDLTPEQRSEIRGLYREMQRAVEEELGPDESRGDRAGAYAFLPPDKAEAARRIDADYAELSRELRDRMDEFRLPSDRDALRLLEEERRADLAALLSPEEALGLEMRTSPVSARLRRELGTAVQSEEEFRRIYELATAFEAQFGRGGAEGDMGRGDRRAAESAFRQEIMEILGPERAAVLARQRDPDYRTMQAATVRLGLPSSATDAVLAARAEAAAESQRIASDPSLDGGARRAALAAVAERVRGQLKATMGAEGAEAFAGRAEWLRGLERGSPFNLRPEGGVEVQRGRGGGGG